jgi:hypothetical protein
MNNLNLSPEIISKYCHCNPAPAAPSHAPVTLEPLLIYQVTQSNRRHRRTHPDFKGLIGKAYHRVYQAWWRLNTSKGRRRHLYFCEFRQGFSVAKIMHRHHVKRLTVERILREEMR